ncbi:hypothetical protein COV06_00635 [Candidatus Uhrbacteria bacterium CG10_big_fil_rev_8_21_14_0_10_50_16]|uniref:Uncharacterized protein n=1 Tax=Candidatus Uhrbacteria bacterium CG10_big_fil_rev_8_21_14_0_10_50_16 TaxID=1975039 RepID=A0A2H0RN12_9BACT|nr:MAG: hypothetical protein COV06_00635 [Candidatus Uhrbacteria bacterium CG10_big_fil_rev_8_21_14_0_10_50_16]
MAAPFILLFLTLTGYAITNFMIAELVGDNDLTADSPATQSEVQPVQSRLVKNEETGMFNLVAEEPGTDLPDSSGEHSTQAALGNLINVILGFVGVIAVLGMYICVPLGVYLLATKDKPKNI